MNMLKTKTKFRLRKSSIPSNIRASAPKINESNFNKLNHENINIHRGCIQNSNIHGEYIKNCEDVIVNDDDDDVNDNGNDNDNDNDNDNGGGGDNDGDGDIENHLGISHKKFVRMFSPQQQPTAAQKVLNSKLYPIFYLFMVIFCSIVFLVSVYYLLSNYDESKPSQSSPNIMDSDQSNSSNRWWLFFFGISEFFVICLLILEVILKVASQGLKLYFQQYENWFDLFITSTSILLFALCISINHFKQKSMTFNIIILVYPILTMFRYITQFFRIFCLLYKKNKRGYHSKKYLDLSRDDTDEYITALFTTPSSIATSLSSSKH